MIPLNLTLSPRPPHPPLSLSSLFLSPFPILKLSSTSTLHRRRSFNQFLKNQRLLRRRGICRAELSNDAPFAIAIGACMLNSLLFPYVGDSEEENGAISATDARFTVMSIISFIPYFNWLSWIFAWMDTGKRRYAIYAAVYLTPYIRTNLSLSPEESWLPIASIVLCIVHVQLEASIRNGDIDGFTFFSEAAKRLGLIAGSKDNQRRRNMHEGRRPNDINLPSGKAHSRDEIRKWRVPRKPSQDLEHDDVDDKMED